MQARHFKEQDIAGNIYFRHISNATSNFYCIPDIYFLQNSVIASPYLRGMGTLTVWINSLLL